MARTRKLPSLAIPSATRFPQLQTCKNGGSRSNQVPAEHMVHTDPNHVDGESGSIITQSTRVISASATSSRVVPPSCPPNIDRESNTGVISGEDAAGQDFFDQGR